MLDFDDLPPMIDVAHLSMPAGTEVEQADLDAVCNDIRVACGWHIAPRVTAMEMVVNAQGGTILTVPSLRMGEPSSIVDANGAAITGWTWSQNGILEGSWPSGLRSVTVTADSGFVACPASVRAVIEDMLADRTNVREGGGFSQIALDGATLTSANPYAPRGSSSDVGVRRNLMDAYGHILGRYAIR
ncbi:head-to-tail adaptor [Gordonia phage OneDirection]|nr:head-to-tail adaptor [Gordonia phage OneDirection]